MTNVLLETHHASARYEQDFVRWSEEQARLLRERFAGSQADGLDWPNIIAEIESLGRSERSALASDIRTIIEHLAKLQVSPATAPRAGWEETVLRARADAEALLEDSPSVRSGLDAVIDREHRRATKIVEAALVRHNEGPTLPLDRIRYSADQILGSWLP